MKICCCWCFVPKKSLVHRSTYHHIFEMFDSMFLVSYLDNCLSDGKKLLVHYLSLSMVQQHPVIAAAASRSLNNSRPHRSTEPLSVLSSSGLTLPAFAPISTATSSSILFRVLVFHKSDERRLRPPPPPLLLLQQRARPDIRTARGTRETDTDGRIRSATRASRHSS